MNGARLEAAIDELYEVFDGHRPRAAIPVCAHCVSADDVAALGAGPVRTLSGPALGRFAEKAITTWGGTSELRAFLPRLCELAAAGDAQVPITTVADKLRAARWQSWPADEREAVLVFIDALWYSAITRWPPPIDLLALVRAVATSVDDVGPFLDEWNRLAGVDSPTRDALVLNLAALVTGAAPSVGRNRLLLTIEAWLLGTTTRLQLERAAYDCEGRPAGRAARRAVSVLGVARRHKI